MGGVAGDGDGTAARSLQNADAAQQGGQRVGAGAQACGRAVGHADIADQDGGQVVLVALGGGLQGEAAHEFGAGQRPHAAQHAQHLVGGHAKNPSHVSFTPSRTSARVMMR